MGARYNILTFFAVSLLGFLCHDPSAHSDGPTDGTFEGLSLGRWWLCEATCSFLPAQTSLCSLSEPLQLNIWSIYKS